MPPPLQIRDGEGNIAVAMAEPATEDLEESAAEAAGIGEARRRWRPSLGAVLMVTLLLSVLLTAGLIHFSWQAVARGNLKDLVGQLNDKIAGSIQQEVASVIANATAAQEALRTIFFQNVITPQDEAKREFIFLALLQSQPSLSWISFGWPDGHFFGAEKLGDESILMVEVTWDTAHKMAQRRVDSYKVITGDIEFEQRNFTDSQFDASQQPWYVRAMAADKPVWSDISQFPTETKPAIAISSQLEVYGKFQGIICVAIELERLSQFLAGIQVARNGTVAIVDAEGHIVAAPELAEKSDEAGAATASTAVMNDAIRDKLNKVAMEALHHFGMQLGQIHATMSWDYRSTVDRDDYFVTFTPLGFNGWLVATVIPASDFLAEVERNTRRLAWIVGFFTLIMANGAIWFARAAISRPLRRVIAELRHIENFELHRVQRMNSFLSEIDRLSGALVHMASGLASFQKYVPTELVRRLLKQGIEAKPGGTHLPITVMFTDLAGFTALSEKLGDAVVPVLAEYLSRMSPIIAEGRGVIDKFIGDAIMALWGAPEPNPDHALDACRVALACQQALATLGLEAQAQGRLPLKMRVGINSGNILVGNIGSEERLNYTAIGDSVNVASRLEALNKRYGTATLIGEETRRQAGDAILVRRLDRVAVYGKKEGIAIYELIGLPAERPRLEPLGWIALYEQGLDLYAQRKFAEAIDAFKAADRERPDGDPPARLFIERAKAFMIVPPPPNWMAVTVLAEK
ncbi:adenylate/guanylate cyclase domain-containing protein [Hypericibacter terrae]|uniref:Adenylate/guanylate cyclase domain-containing protein n=2 Tax=Hypericibacter terrae TaxID=2602015 RepID=A0A5J6MG69_9PROT|nr:adenylate/guanylate cyclase domain-containing protein [Hypericibacter terrae]